MLLSVKVPLLVLPLALLLAGCDPPVAQHREEVPLRLYRWSPEGDLPPEPAPGEPLRVEVLLHRQGALAQAVLRTWGGLPAEGDAALLLEGPGGERAGEAYGDGKRPVMVWGRADRPACAWWMVSLSPDPWREDETETRFYQAHGRVCEEGR